MEGGAAVGVGPTLPTPTHYQCAGIFLGKHMQGPATVGLGDGDSIVSSEHIYIGVAFEAAGWHPSAWREPSSQPERLFTAGYWSELVSIAEAGSLDFVTIEDSLALQSSERLLPDDRTDEVRGRLDALLIASAVGPQTQRIGLIPVVTTTLTEPFHVSKAVATLDYTSGARAGFQARLSLTQEELEHVGRRDFLEDATLDELRNSPAVDQAFAEAADFVEAVRRLWDSWEDDAEIRDVGTDRFIDPDKLHTIDFEGRTFSVRGPSITPRPPQGQPLVAALAHDDIPYHFVARVADIVFTTPKLDSPTEVVQQVRAAEQEVDRQGEPLKISADLVVLLDETDGETGRERLDRLNSLGRSLESDAAVLAGSADEVAGVIRQLKEAGFNGVRLRPGVVADDLPRITKQLVPLLRDQGLLAGDGPEPQSLRTRLGLSAEVPNRYQGQTGHISPAPASAL